MSIPTSLRVGPFASIVLVKKRYLIFYLFLMWISILSALMELYFFWNYTYMQNGRISFIILLLPMLFIMYATMVLTSLLFAKILLVITSLFHTPREGVFLRDKSSKDYRYWSLRNTIKRWPVWLAHKLPLPFFDNLCFKVFGVKTTLSNSLFEGWVDCEFIEFGENVIVGQASLIQSALIMGNLLIIRKTIIEDNVRIGAHVVIMPGTHIEKNCVIAASSVTTVGQKLEEGWIYLGIPATKYKKNRFFEDDIQEKIGKVEDIEGLRDKYEEKYLKWYDDDMTWAERKKTIKQKKEDEKRRLKQGKVQ